MCFMYKELCIEDRYMKRLKIYSLFIVCFFYSVLNLRMQTTGETVL